MKFTWLDKYTQVLEQVPDESERARLALAIVEYGSKGVEPELEYPLSALFAALRDDLDYSRAAHENGKKGGRPKKEQAEACSEEPENEEENPSKPSLFEPFSESKNPQTGTLFENEKPKAKQSNAMQSKERSASSGPPDGAFDEIVGCLNEECGTNYRSSTPKTQRLIRARWAEGFRIPDFRAVIGRKAADWRGTDMERYLRPETLFGTKFEGYLNEGGGVDGRFDKYDV